MNRIASLLALACAVFSAGCATRYNRVIETNVRGERTVEWIAEGDVKRTDERFWRFKAVERRDDANSKMVTHYPLGRTVVIGAPNVLVEPTRKPAWLAEMDANADTRYFPPLDFLHRKQAARAGDF